MTYYNSKYKFSTSQIVGAIVLLVSKDLYINFFTFPGFPQIEVPDPINGVFTITLSWMASTRSSVSFEITMEEAKTAAIMFKNEEGYYRKIFRRVQAALAELEGRDPIQL